MHYSCYTKNIMKLKKSIVRNILNARKTGKWKERETKYDLSEQQSPVLHLTKRQLNCKYASQFDIAGLFEEVTRSRFV